MLYEDLRHEHEDIERLEQAIADRVREEPKHIRHRLERDHEIATFLSQLHTQSTRALHIYTAEQEALTQEAQALSTGDVFEEFYRQLDGVRAFHKKYPHEPVENLERAYRRREDGSAGFAGDVDAMFTGEEAYGRFFDLTRLHEEYLNLPGVKGQRKLTYLQYLDTFDVFTPPQCAVSRKEKETEAYFGYVNSLAQYLESFMRRTKPLEDLEKLFRAFDEEFERLWAADEVPGWEEKRPAAAAERKPVTEGTGEGIWCAACAKEFQNDSVYKAHLTGKKHARNAAALEQAQNSTNGDVDMPNATTPASTERTKQKALAEREHRTRKLTSAMQTERADTRVNVERKAGMTDRERQQELAALYAEDASAASARNAGGGASGNDAEDADDEEEKLYNPLKLPLAWDGKPIPFWLYKLHGLGVEFPCEICGNYVYMGRRAFDKHFSEPRHVYGLKCLGITGQSALFREITGIEEALRLWEKVQRDKSKVREKGEGVVEMEDTEGNVMPYRVWEDLGKQGLL